MSVIFPSELAAQYELDYENSIVGSLLLSGTGIYFSDDNLTTVVNYYDNSAGTPTDITSNELAALGDYRIGVDVSGLTTDQQASVTANPYQLFKTAATKRDEYCVSLTTSSEQISLPFVGAFTGIITLEDDTTQAISGSGTYIIGGTVPKRIKSIRATDTANNYLWIFDRKDSPTTIADEYNGAIATLNGSPTFEPIIEKQVYTVGSDKDYTQISSAVSAQKQDLVANNRQLVFEVYGVCPAMSFPDFRGYNTNATCGVIVQGETEDAEIVTNSIYLGVTDSGSFVGWKNLIYSGFTNVINTAYGDKVNWIYDSVTIKSSGSGNCSVGNSSLFKDCLLINAFLDGSTVKANNCMVVLQTGTWFESNRWDIFLRTTTPENIVNLVAYVEFTGDYGGFYNTSGGYNVITNLSDLGLGGSQSNVDMTGWFDTNGMLTDTAQTVLKGAGWNGSDIASSFYAIASTGLSVTVTESLSQYIDSAVIDVQANISVSVTESLQSYSDSSNVTVTPSVNIDITVTESLKSYQDNSSVTVTETGEISATVTETLQSFSDASLIDIQRSIAATVTESLNSYSDNVNVTIAKELTAEITEVLSSYVDNGVVRLPTQWAGKPNVSTEWTAKTKVTTIWSNK